MRCPICKKPVNVASGPGSSTPKYFPFCSERCRIIDLGNWAAEKYVISSPAKPEGTPETDDDEAGEQ